MSKILIVDDRLIDRRSSVALNYSRNHHLLEASDGAEALRLARAEHPDLIISEVLMPTMDGYEFVRQLRADPIISQTPVIFSTAQHLSREARALAASCGVSSIIYRPSAPEEVLRIVNAALEGGHNPEPSLSVDREVFDHDHLQLLTDTLSKKTDELKAVNEKLTALIKLSHQMTPERDPLNLMKRYSQVARDIIGAKWNAFGVLSDDMQTLQHFYTVGLEDEIARRISPPSPLEGIFATLLNEGHSCRIRVLDGDVKAVGLPSDFPSLSSCLGLPIIFQKRVYGWLCLANKLGADEFSDEDEEMAVTLVNQMAAAYENATLYNQAQFRAAELEREIDERQRAENKLRTKNEELAAMTQQFWHASKLATMGELAANVAHELNNPLATVSLRTESLIGEFAEDDPKRHALKIIEQEVERMGGLVSNLLQFSRRHHQQFSTMDVRIEIRNTLEFINHHLRNHQVSVVCDLAHNLPSLHADRQQLRQVFLNLVVNASDSMPQSGTLTVSATEGRFENGAGAIVIEFVDTGSGIEGDDLAKVWEPFFTTKEENKGTGLGLAICRRIIEEHRGMISMKSIVGQGTTVRIMLPTPEGDEQRRLLTSSPTVNPVAGEKEVFVKR